MLVLLLVLGSMLLLLLVSRLFAGRSSHYIADRVPAGNGEGHDKYTARQGGF